jgi:putative ABC transport system substrate-binding protein
MPVVGFINGAFPAPRNFAVFVQGLKEARFVVDSQNVLIEARWAEGNYARLPAIVDELNPNGSSPGSAGEAAKV